MGTYCLKRKIGVEPNVNVYGNLTLGELNGKLYYEGFSSSNYFKSIPEQLVQYMETSSEWELQLAFSYKEDKSDIQMLWSQGGSKPDRLYINTTGTLIFDYWYNASSYSVIFDDVSFVAGDRIHTIKINFKAGEDGHNDYTVSILHDSGWKTYNTQIRRKTSGEDQNAFGVILGNGDNYHPFKGRIFISDCSFSADLGNGLETIWCGEKPIIKNYLLLSNVGILYGTSEIVKDQFSVDVNSDVSPATLKLADRSKLWYPQGNGPNCAIVGNPNVVKNVASGFTNASYLLTPQYVDLNAADKFEIVIAAKGNDGILMCAVADGLPFVVIDSSSMYVITEDESILEIASGIPNDGTTKLWYKLTYNIVEGYIAYTSTDGNNYSEVGRLNDTRKLYKGYARFFIGVGKSGNQPFQGEIYLRDSWIKTGRDEIWRGGFGNKDVLYFNEGMVMYPKVNLQTNNEMTLMGVVDTKTGTEIINFSENTNQLFVRDYPPSKAEMRTGAEVVWYDTASNLSFIWYDEKWNITNLCLPFYKYTYDGTTLKESKVLYGYSEMGNYLFLLKGTKFKTANGFENGKPKGREIVVNENFPIELVITEDNSDASVDPDPGYTDSDDVGEFSISPLAGDVTIEEFTTKHIAFDGEQAWVFDTYHEGTKAPTTGSSVLWYNPETNVFTFCFTNGTTYTKDCCYIGSAVSSHLRIKEFNFNSPRQLTKPYILQRSK